MSASNFDKELDWFLDPQVCFLLILVVKSEEKQLALQFASLSFPSIPRLGLLLYRKVSSIEVLRDILILKICLEVSRTIP